MRSPAFPFGNGPPRVSQSRAVVAARRREAIAVAVVLLAVALSLADAVAGIAAYERDTGVFYFPLAQWAQERLQTGVFPLWTSRIYGGYPLFADGELGLANPLVLATLFVLPAEQAFLLLRLVHLAVAALGMYALARAWHLNPAPSALAGVTFALGSFLQAQISHENIVRTAAWLPVALTCIERALRTARRSRVRWACGAALAVGLAGLGLHVQILAMDLAVVAAYGLARVWIGPLRGGVRRWTRLAHVGWLLGLIVGLGLTVAAVQLVPLAELAGVSARGQGLTYAEAAAYSLSPFDLARMVLPFAFRGPGNVEWGLWAYWETTVYVGLAPLLLSAMALASRRRAEVLAWGALGLIGVLLALGQYGPLGLYPWLWQLPVVNVLRAPGRFTLLVVLALAMLAAHGMAHLQRAARRGPGGRALPAVLGASALAVLAAVLGAHALLLLFRDTVRTVFAARYLALPRETNLLNTEHVYQGMLWVTDLANRRTAGALLLLLGLLTGLVVWRSAPARGVRAWRGWPWLFVIATVGDLLLFSYYLHPRAQLADVVRPHPSAGAVEALMAQARAAGDGPYRALVDSSIRGLQPNRLVPLGVEEAGGYTSLQFRRQRDVLTRVREVDDDLLDLWNVRFVVKPVEQERGTVYRGVAYRPGSLLLSGATLSALGTETFRVPPGAAEIIEVRVVAALVDAVGLPQGSPVADVTLRGADGGVVAWSHLLAGVDVMDWGADLPAIGAALRHNRVERAGTVIVEPGQGPGSVRALSFGRVLLPTVVAAHSLEIRTVTPAGRLLVYGASTVDADGRTFQLFGRSKTKYREVYRDGDTVVLENLAAYPRAFITPSARREAVPGTTLLEMQQGSFEPRQEVILSADSGERASAVPSGARPLVAPARLGLARISHYGANDVQVEVEGREAGYLVLSDSYYPGWSAYVDGQEQRILRGDVLFRVVPLSAGTHTVIFRYEPLSVVAGLVVSSLGLLICTVGLVARPLRRRLALRAARLN